MYYVSFDDSEFMLGKQNDQVVYFGPTVSTLAEATIRGESEDIHFNLVSRRSNDDHLVGKFFDDTGHVVAVMRRSDELTIPTYIN